MRSWDPEAFRTMCADAGTSPEEVAMVAHLKPNRFDFIEENGYDPFVYEVWRIAEVLGTTTDEVIYRCFEVVE